MRNTMKRVAVATVAASALLATASGAQSSAGPRWQAWLGCWTAAQPGAAAMGSPALSGPTVCVSPTADANVVDIATIAGGKVVARDRIDASGRDNPINARNCTGVQQARFSSDERRVFLKSAATCEGMKSATSAILAMTAQGDWIDVRNVITYGDANVRVARYHDAGMPSSIPADIAAALSGRSMASQGARIAAGAPVGTNAVVEASHLADSSVVSAWLLERGQRFALDANDLVTLADAGVPAAVTDAMVAVSYPNAFATARGDRNDADDDYPANRRQYVTMDPYYDPYGYGYSRYGNPAYGNGYGYGYGYGYGGYSGGYYGNPIIIVAPGAAAAHGQMVKGHGYTQNQPSSTSERAGTGRANPSTSSGSSSGSSSSGSTASAPAPAATAAPAPQPSAERTAHPRP